VGPLVYLRSSNSESDFVFVVVFVPDDVDLVAVDFVLVDLVAVDFVAVDFVAVDFFAVERFAEARFDDARFDGTFAPFSRASDSPIAIACLRLVTVPPCPALPRFSVPAFRRCIALLTDFPALRPYLRPPLARFVAMSSPGEMSTSVVATAFRQT
jgi:hypothetical protein